MKQYAAGVAAASTALSVGILLAGCSMGKTRNEADLQSVPSAAATPEIPDLQLAETLFENQDCVKAFRIFQQHAENGDPEAEAWLARCYMNGVGTTVDFAKAHEYFQRAAEKNNPWGINGLGVCFQYGFGTAVNLQKAKDLYLRAAKMNHPLGTLNLARTYADEEGGFFDPEQAETFYKKAVELNAPAAKSIYAAFLFARNRYPDAIRLAKESLEYPQSMRIMAQCYENGWGVPLDISHAVELAEAHFNQFEASTWSAEICYHAGLEEMIMNGMTEFAKRCFRNAADQGHLESQYLHARNLLKSNDRAGALRYMRRASDRGDGRAMIEEGKMLVDQADYEQALRYFSQAALDVRVREEAVCNLSKTYHYKLNEPREGLFWDQKGVALGIDFCRNEIALSEIQQNGDEHFAKAAALFAETSIGENEFAANFLNDILEKEYERLRTLADQGNADALLTLGVIGCLEEKGHPNVPIGMELLEKAAKSESALACCLLGNIYRDGVLIKKDLKKALEWYRRGAAMGNADSARNAALMLFYEEEFKDTKLDELQKAFDRCLELEIFSVAFEYGEIMEFSAKNPEKAENLYRISAEHSDTRAMLRLHDMLMEKNKDESFFFLYKAVDLESPEAELRMGDIQKIWKQPRKSFLYYVKADLHGDAVEPPYRMAECWLNGYGCEMNLNCFWNAANKAYENGCAEVCFLLGSVYQEGKICAKDPKKAREYFEIGAKRGSEACRTALK